MGASEAAAAGGRVAGGVDGGVERVGFEGGRGGEGGDGAAVGGELVAGD